MLLAETCRDHFSFPSLTPFIGGLDRDDYLRAAGRAIRRRSRSCGSRARRDRSRCTRRRCPDFATTESLWGVRAVDLVNARARRTSALRTARRQAAAGRADLQPRDPRRARQEGALISLRRHRSRSRRRVGRRPRLVLQAEQVRDSLARTSVGTAHVLPARRAGPARRSRGLAAEAAVLVRRRRHHLRAHRRAARRDPAGTAAQLHPAGTDVVHARRSRRRTARRRSRSAS